MKYSFSHLIFIMILLYCSTMKYFIDIKAPGWELQFY